MISVYRTCGWKFAHIQLPLLLSKKLSMIFWSGTANWSSHRILLFLQKVVKLQRVERSQEEFSADQFVIDAEEAGIGWHSRAEDEHSSHNSFESGLEDPGLPECYLASQSFAMTTQQQCQMCTAPQHYQASNGPQYCLATGGCPQQSCIWWWSTT